MPNRSAAAALGLAFCLALCSGPAAPALAQGLHPLPQGPRPLHIRLAAADAVAIGIVASIEPGRVAVGDASPLLGNPGASFLIKRSPSAPPPLAVGVRALFLLRGARSPYLMVDEPREVSLLQSDADATRWAELVRELIEARGRPDRLRGIYLQLLDREDDALQQLAGAALLDARSGLTPLPPEAARVQARAASDPSRNAHGRRVSTLLALGEPSALAILLEATPGPDADPRVVDLTLRAGAQSGSLTFAAALQRTLSHADPEIRRAGLGAAGLAWNEAVAERLTAMGEDDPDPRLRRDAKRLLNRQSGRPADATAAELRRSQRSAEEMQHQAE